jgi:hypothetical protein
VCGSNNKSPIGRTKTSPDEHDSVSKISLAVFSCSNYPSGYFNAYGNAARKDEVDFFVRQMHKMPFLRNQTNIPRFILETTSTRLVGELSAGIRVRPHRVERFSLSMIIGLASDNIAPT